MHNREDLSERMTILRELRKRIDGELLLDRVKRSIYATDASIYQIQPLGVALPKHEKDILNIVEFCRKQDIPILPRSGGTSLAGQTVGECLVVDFSKYFNRIIEFRPEEKWIRVQPGIVLDNLNHFLSPHGLQFAPDPATSSRAGIGGMIANNSSGTRSILYGKTIDHLLSARILLSDGQVLDLGGSSVSKYTEKAALPGREGDIYRHLREIIFENSEEIIDRYPKTMRRVSGYPLDEFVGKENWNLAKLLAGSEGTLGIILEAQLNLEPLPARKTCCIVHFHSLADAILAVRPILPYQPAAVELLNEDVLHLSRENRETRKATSYLEGEPAAVLLVEFYGKEEEELQERCNTMIFALRQEGIGYAYPCFPEGKVYNEIWAMRKKGLGLLMGTPSRTKPLPFIEDAALPIPVLPEYIENILSFCKDQGVRVAAYAHASVGVIHVRPFLDLSKPDDIVLLRKISAYAFSRVKHFKGSWSSEHGDGLSRGEYIREFYGTRIYELFVKVKELFDPIYLFNPGKIIQVPPMDRQLRKGAMQLPADFKPRFHYRDQIDLEHAVLQCTGIGVCRKTLNGTMCPSYMVTRDEEHSTRGRANALRMAIEGNFDLSNEEGLHEAFDLCLSCKACKSECPSNVDMARLKSELLQYRHQKRGVSFGIRAVRDSAVLARKFSGSLAPVVNWVQGSGLFRAMPQSWLGFDKRRKLPSYSKETFNRWMKRRTQSEGSAGHVYLFADTYINYHETSTGRRIVEVLEAFNLEVRVISGFCCQRPRISNGFLDLARANGRLLAERIRPVLERGEKILVCEPSCHSALTDDLPDLFEDDKLGILMKENILPVENYLLEIIQKQGNPGLEIPLEPVLLHGHCHQKALTGTSDIHSLFSALGHQGLHEPDSGCCGMAGAFGYEKGHLDISRMIGERVLFPAIGSMEKEGLIAAAGFSCRHQIRDFTGADAKHWIEYIKVRKDA